MTGTLDAPIAVDRPDPPAGPVSFEQFLAWADEDTHAEWVDGRVVLMSPVNLDLAPNDADGFFHSTVLPGFRLQVAWLWQRPLPPIADLVDLIQA